jgi:16S rRNA (guanine527-N7)-methyltransferase
LLELLAAARSQHFLGPGDVAGHLGHSLAFASLITEAPGLAVDLGSGAGIPGLVLALLWPASHWVLLDANVRRTTFLRDALPTLGLDARVEVVTTRTELAGRHPRWRGAADLVVARGFGPPAVTAESAAPFLRTGGAVVVAEPPGGAPGRWPAAGLELLGLTEDGTVVVPVALQRLRQARPCPERYPRRVGIPQKRPLF